MSIVDDARTRILALFESGAIDGDQFDRLNTGFDALEQQVERAQGALDLERQRPPLGRYAFYHRHLALSYVLDHDPVLHNQALLFAARKIDAEGGRSFTDVVAGLEAELAALRARLPVLEAAAGAEPPQ